MKSSGATDKPLRTMTDEERKDYGARYAAGTITLSTALRGLILTRQVIPPHVAEDVHRAFLLYDIGEVDDLAIPFGCAMTDKDRTKQRKAWARTQRFDKVCAAVLTLHELGHPLTDPTYHQNTAFELAAADLGMSPSLVFDVYRSRR